MKIKLNKWLGLTASSLLFLTGFNSCIKNHVAKETDFSKVVNVVDLPVNGFKALTFDISPEPQVVKIYVELGGPIPDKDVQVTLALDPTGLLDYNAANSSSYTILPDSAYSLPNLTATIKKGERLATLDLTIFSNKVDLSVANAIPLKIVDAHGIAIADNLKSIVYAIVVKNEWDGDYDVTGWFFHPSAGREINTIKHLGTLNATSVEGSVGDLGTPFDMQIDNNNQTIWLAGPYLSTGFMTADNPGGVDYASCGCNGGFLPGDATFNKTIYNNTYDPATKTFYLHYGYNASASGDQSVYTRQIYEKWVRR